jgi:hypothetical protein
MFLLIKTADCRTKWLSIAIDKNSFPKFLHIRTPHRGLTEQWVSFLPNIHMIRIR